MYKNSVVTVGVFDGVHSGHKAIIKKVVKKAKSLGLKSVVVTFDPHPLRVLDPNHFVPSLMSLKHRINLIKELGIEEVLVMKFNKKVAKLSAKRFVEDILIKKMGAKYIVVGEDFCFGKGALANTRKLKAICEERSVKIEIVMAVKKNSHIISSTIIRRLIMDGDIHGASRLLGRPFSILGTVVKGTKLARTLGYPTANLNPHHEAMPPTGVYAVRIGFEGKTYNGVMNIGVKPTFYNHGRDKEPEIEVHIFDFAEAIYGRQVEVEFCKKLRDEEWFENLDLLKDQMVIDAEQARDYFDKLSG